MFALTGVSLAIDAWGVHFHTRHAGFLSLASPGAPPSPGSSPAGGGPISVSGSGRQRSGVWRRKPRFTAVASAVIDGVMILCTVQALVEQAR